MRKTTLGFAVAATLSLVASTASAAKVAEYKFDGDAKDTSGNGYDGTLVGDATFVDSPWGKALKLDGNGDYVTVPIPSRNFAKFTMEAWINVPTYESNVHYISLYQNAYLVLGDWDSGKIATSWAAGLNPVDAASSITQAAQVNNTWHHMALTYDGAAQKLYIDGVLAGTQASTGTVTLDANVYNQGLVIGARYTKNTQFVNGLLDNVRLWDEDLPIGALGWSKDGGCGPNVAEGGACDDGDGCTQTDVCTGGKCVGSNPVVCAAKDQCHVAGVCNSQTGLCTDPNKDDGTACSDNDKCTQTDTCQAGVCTGANPVVCAKKDECHVVGVCDKGTGTCSDPNATDGIACTGGTCAAGICAPPGGGSTSSSSSSTSSSGSSGSSGASSGETSSGSSGSSGETGSSSGSSGDPGAGASSSSSSSGSGGGGAGCAVGGTAGASGSVMAIGLVALASLVRRRKRA